MWLFLQEFCCTIILVLKTQKCSPGNSSVTRKHGTITKYSEKPSVVCALTDGAVCTSTDLGSWYHLVSCMFTGRISQAKNSTQQTAVIKYLPAEVLDTVQAVLYTKRHPQLYEPDPILHCNCQGKITRNNKHLCQQMNVLGHITFTDLVLLESSVQRIGTTCVCQQ